MAETSWPYAGDSVQEPEWMAMSRLWRRSGVIDGADNELAVTAVTGELKVSVATGEGWLDGFYYSNSTAKQLTLAAADLNDPRIDLIVVRSDRTAGDATLKVITGTAAVSPVAPTVTQDHEGSGVYEVALAEVTVAAAASNVDGQVTDVRTFSLVPQDDGFVKTTTDQTVGGVKTFSSSPVVPAPTTDLQAATKRYVDDNAGGGVATFHVFGADVEVSHVDFATVAFLDTVFFSHVRNSSGTQNNEVVFRLSQALEAGTWSLSLTHLTGINRGIYTVAVSPDASAWTDLTTIDGYADPSAVARSVVTGLTVATGMVYVRMKMATKNASSSAYMGSLSNLSGIRTGA